MKILNLTQHKISPEQIKAGVEDYGNPKEIRKLLTFDEVPHYALLHQRAKVLATICLNSGYTYAMIGGAPFLMGILEDYLFYAGVTPIYAFSKRDVVETGGVKVSTFVHLGFVYPKGEKNG